MKKISIAAAVFFLGAGFAFAQNREKDFVEHMSYEKYADMLLRIDSLQEHKPSDAPSLKQVEAEIKKLTAQTDGWWDELLKNAGASGGFMRFTAAKDSHKAPYYNTLAHFLVKTANARHMIPGGESDLAFKDGEDFTKQYAGYDFYDFYKPDFAMFGDKAEFHKIDHITNVGPADNMRMILYIDGKPSVSVSFIRHMSTGREEVYVHVWETGKKIVDGKEVSGLFSKNITPSGAEYQALTTELYAARAPFNE